MQYRQLGNTGIKVSEIGMGCEGFAGDGLRNVKRFLDLAEEKGVNYFDLYTPDPAVRKSIGEALKGRREKFVIQSHICSVWKDGQYKRSRDIGEVKEGFEQMMSLLDTDYIDVGMIHYVDSMEDWDTVVNGPVLSYAKELKEAGRIRHIGLSSHNPKVAKEAVESGYIEVLMFSVNPCYDLQPASEDVEDLWKDENYAAPLVNMDPERQELYETCQRLGVGIKVMKAFGGGELLDEKSPNLNLYVDPKCSWALAHMEHFPLEINTAPYEELLRIPGIGVRSAQRILKARKTGKITWEGAKKMGVVLKRAQYFLTFSGKMAQGLKITSESVLRALMGERQAGIFEEQAAGRQLSLFDPPPITREEVYQCLTGEI